MKTDDSIFTPKYRAYTLFVLTAVYVFSFIDRQILVILQESIKEELSLSDTQLGLMSGFSFALFYVSFGLPIARLADKGNRRNIIALSLLIWSAMTALSGRASNFVHLLLARFGVGIGEAGCSPPAHSIISDLYPREKRGTAMAIYSMGISIGILVGFLGGGWINEYFGWRTAFLAIGLPGILLALLLRFTVKEPPRGLSDNKEIKEDSPDIGTVVKMLWNSTAFRYLALGASLSTYTLYTLNSWLPPFLNRIHHMGSGEIGTWLSLLFGIGGGLGYFFGGYLSDRLGRNNEKWYMILPAIGILSAIPFTALTLFSNQSWLALVSFALPVFSISMYLAPCIAMTHSIVGVRMRAFASAVLFFIINIIGLGCGPLITGVLSDLWHPSMGDESLRWALSTCLIAHLLAAFFYLKASRALKN
ncbi:MFS transporter [Muricauda oceani]|uniref:spinster family MFS transporter n=1 Tax=Flagellimonas oceani TaxID=2698672 RepID=UPI00197C117E|nr:MFS transporter [Allomuricauda oceani]MBW8243663.1 MFS transporter [Allomuricauda oceani]